MLIVVVISLVGDSIILIASIKYNAFKLNKITVVLIRHIAVNDLLYSVGAIGPGMISAIYNTGNPYRFLDYVRFAVAYYTAPVGSILISVFTLSKVLLLKYPFRVGLLSTRQANKMCVGVWIFCLHVPILPLVINKNDVVFDYRTYYCTYIYTSKIWQTLLPVQALVVLFIPNTIVIVSTVMLLKEAKQAAKEHQKSLRWQGITTVGFTALVYTVSFLPYNFYLIAEPFVAKDPVNPGPFYIEFFRAANGFIILHVLSNFFVYSLTVESFRSFLFGVLRSRQPVSMKGISRQGKHFMFYVYFMLQTVQLFIPTESENKATQGYNYINNSLTVLHHHRDR